VYHLAVTCVPAGVRGAHRTCSSCVADGCGIPRKVNTEWYVTKNSDV
jgi:hypothetical protein